MAPDGGRPVDHPLTLSLADLQERFTRREVVATLRCAGNRRLGLLGVRDIPGETPSRTRPRTTPTASHSAVAVNADVLVPADDATMLAGPTAIRGYAFAGHDRSVGRVDLSTDDGTH